MSIKPEQGLLACVAPLPEELSAVRRTAASKRRFPTRGPGRFWTAEIGGRPAVLGWTGDGRRQARDGLGALLEDVEVGQLVLLGVAGGLTPSLGFAEVVAGHQVHGADGLAPPPDPRLVAAALAAGARSGLLHTHGEILANSGSKLALGEKLAARGLDATEATVDLETAVYAHVAALYGVPYVALRAVSDPAEETLALDFAHFADADGQTQRWRVVVYAMTHPWLIPELLRLARRVAVCAESLDRVVSRLIVAC